MNKRGGLFLGVVIAVVIFIAGVLFIQYMKSDVTSARVSLSCATPDNITDGTKLLCLLIGGAVPYYIIIFVSIAMGFVTRAIT